MFPVPSDSVRVELRGQSFEAEPKRFASGSVGWHYSGKVQIDGDRVQVSLSLVVVGTKPKSLDGKEGPMLPRVDSPLEAARKPAKARKAPKTT